jgi:class 3 adenylate cyclase
MLAAPVIEFAERGGSHIAYQAAGDGPLEIMFVGGSFATSTAWEESAYAKPFRRLASFSRFVTYDQRGMGYSDPIDPAALPTLDDLVADLGAVIEAAGFTEPVLFGQHNGGAVAAAYAATHPVRSLVLCNTWARLSKADDYPIGFNEHILDDLAERYRRDWGQGRFVNFFARPRTELSARKFELASTSRNQAAGLFQMNRDYDIRALLSSIAVPTLVIHLRENFNIPPTFGEYVASAIPDAQFVLVPGTDQFFLRNYGDPVIDEVEQFVTGQRTVFADRVVITMLFTDIVDSTPMAAVLGNDRWSSTIDQHNDLVRQQIAAHGGDEVKCTGDGFLVAFDKPAPAIHCALAAMRSVNELGLELRAGVHLGEVTRMGNSDLSGLAVHFAQRLCAQAGPGEVLSSSAAVDGCDDAAITFEGKGSARLKGIPGKWEIFDAHLET